MRQKTKTREEIRQRKAEYDKRYYAEHKEHCSALQKKWREENREYIRLYQRAADARRREERSAASEATCKRPRNNNFSLDDMPPQVRIAVEALGRMHNNKPTIV